MVEQPDAEQTVLAMLIAARFVSEDALPYHRQYALPWCSFELVQTARRLELGVVGQAGNRRLRPRW